MDEDKKKTVKIIVIVACLALAITITLATRQGGRGGAEREIWLKCNNPDCGAEYQLLRKELRALMSGGGTPSPMMPTMPVFVCKECEEESAYMAAKCSNEECGSVFIQAFNPDDYPDRCPECGISKMEKRRNKRKEE